ncbi:hypothetical protein GCM10010399_37440 [Dactylosporangium fulvum]
MMTTALQMALRDREFAELITTDGERTGSTSTTNPTHTSTGNQDHRFAFSVEDEQ